MTELRSGLHS